VSRYIEALESEPEEESIFYFLILLFYQKTWKKLTFGKLRMVARKPHEGYERRVQREGGYCGQSGLYLSQNKQAPGKAWLSHFCFCI
jgi:hypothetical protein